MPHLWMLTCTTWHILSLDDTKPSGPHSSSSIFGTSWGPVSFVKCLKIHTVTWASEIWFCWNNLKQNISHVHLYIIYFIPIIQIHASWVDCCRELWLSLLSRKLSQFNTVYCWTWDTRFRLVKAAKLTGHNQQALVTFAFSSLFETRCNFIKVNRCNLRNVANFCS